MHNHPLSNEKHPHQMNVMWVKAFVMEKMLFELNLKVFQNRYWKYATGRQNLLWNIYIFFYFYTLEENISFKAVLRLSDSEYAHCHFFYIHKQNHMYFQLDLNNLKGHKTAVCGSEKNNSRWCHQYFLCLGLIIFNISVTNWRCEILKKLAFRRQFSQLHYWVALWEM